VRIHDSDHQVGLVEREVVVAAVPKDHVAAVRVGLGGTEDRLVVHPGVDDVSTGDVRLVFLHLLDCAIVLCEIVDRGEALHLLRLEIAVGHWVADCNHLKAVCDKGLGDAA